MPQGTTKTPYDTLTTSITYASQCGNELPAAATTRFLDRFSGFGCHEDVVDEPELRSALFHGGDDVLARALVEVGDRAANEGWRLDGFMGWERTPVAEFIGRQLGGQD